MEEQSKQDWERIFGLFKLEYQQAAERYENIYKAIWQIFSYMGILAAGILTFGSRSSSLPIEAIVSITLTPLVFWFFAIYIPMNNYGEKAREHLGEIEEQFNNISEDFLNPPWKLEHYKNFNSSQENSNSKRKGFFEFAKNIINIIIFRGKSSNPWRVKRAIHTFGVIILIAWVIFLSYRYFYSKSNSEKIELKLESLEVTMQEPQLQKLQNEIYSLSQKIDSEVIMPKPQLRKLQNELDSLSQQMDSIESLIRDIKANSNQQ